ncbi:MAG: phosphoglycerate mutase family protein, partial [Pyrinomonadaceae bacterium]
MKKVVSLIAFAFVVSALSCQHPAPPPITVLIVRHAEKASNEDDAPLSAAGVERAQALLRVAEDAGVGAIYSSQFRRNRDTVQPLAARLGLPITEMQVSLNEPGDYSKRLAQDILNKHRGRTVLVVG